MIFDCTESLRRAVKIRAAKTGVEPSEVISQILSQSLEKELAEAEEAIASGHAPGKSKRGRKPKAHE